MRRRTFLELSLGLAVADAAASAVRAQDHPSRPVTLVIPFTPGGSADFLGRIAPETLPTEPGAT